LPEKAFAAERREKENKISENLMVKLDKPDEE
jgi:hypothetical protein